MADTSRKIESYPYKRKLKDTWIRWLFQASLEGALEYRLRRPGIQMASRKWGVKK